MKARLFGAVGVIAAHRAGAAGAAGLGHAVGAVGARDVGGAGRHIVAAPRQRADRAGRETGLVGAAIARARAVVPGRQIEVLGEGEGAAIGMP